MNTPSPDRSEHHPQNAKSVRIRKIEQDFGKKYNAAALEEAIGVWERSLDIRFPLHALLQLCEAEVAFGTRLKQDVVKKIQAYVAQMHREIEEGCIGEELAIPMRIVKILFLEHLLTDATSECRPSFIHKVYRSVQQAGRGIQVDRSQMGIIIPIVLREFVERGWLEGYGAQSYVQEAIDESRDDVREAIGESGTEKVYTLKTDHHQEVQDMLDRMERQVASPNMEGPLQKLDQNMRQIAVSALRFILHETSFSKASLIQSVQADLWTQGLKIDDETVSGNIGRLCRILKQRKCIVPADLPEIPGEGPGEQLA